MSEVFTLKGSQQRASYLRLCCPKGAAIQKVLIIYTKLWGEFPPTPIFKLQNYLVNTLSKFNFFFVFLVFSFAYKLIISKLINSPKNMNK